MLVCTYACGTAVLADEKGILVTVVHDEASRAISEVGKVLATTLQARVTVVPCLLARALYLEFDD